jgi:fructose-1,6-bisphosphatase/inositol monophosphatase family enzyme
VSKTPDIDSVSNILREVAAEEIMPRFKALADDHVWRKSGGSVVTVADEASEARLNEALCSLVPGSVALGEEAAEQDPAALDRLKGDAPVWIIDPVDGTANFAAGKPRFAIIVAYAVGGETVAGWIFDPNNDRMATVEQGGGAWMNGERLSTGAAGPMETLHGALPGRMRRMQNLRARFADIRTTGCVAFEYIALAEGALDFAFYRRLKPWDHAAGQLLHAEAGGYARGLNGAPYRPEPLDGVEGLLLAPNEAHWHLLAEAIGSAAHESWRG